MAGGPEGLGGDGAVEAGRELWGQPAPPSARHRRCNPDKPLNPIAP